MSVLTITVSLCSMALLMRSESSRRTACFSLLAVAMILCCAFVEESSSPSSSSFLLEQLVNTSERSYGIDTLDKLPMKNRVQREVSYQNPREHSNYLKR